MITLSLFVLLFYSSFLSATEPKSYADVGVGGSDPSKGFYAKSNYPVSEEDLSSDGYMGDADEEDFNDAASSDSGSHDSTSPEIQPYNLSPHDQNYDEQSLRNSGRENPAPRRLNENLQENYYPDSYLDPFAGLEVESSNDGDYSRPPRPDEDQPERFRGRQRRDILSSIGSLETVEQYDFPMASPDGNARLLKVANPVNQARFFTNHDVEQGVLMKQRPMSATIHEQAWHNNAEGFYDDVSYGYSDAGSQDYSGYDADTDSALESSQPSGQMLGSEDWSDYQDDLGSLQGQENIYGYFGSSLQDQSTQTVNQVEAGIQTEPVLAEIPTFAQAQPMQDYPKTNNTLGKQKPKTESIQPKNSISRVRIVQPLRRKQRFQEEPLTAPSAKPSSADAKKSVWKKLVSIFQSKNNFLKVIKKANSKMTKILELSRVVDRI